MFAGWITFSAERAGEATVIRAHVLMRANDPLYELGMTFVGHSKEDRFWAQTLTAPGTFLGMPHPQLETHSICVDNRRQWKHAGNIWHNSMLRSMWQTLRASFRRRRHDRT